MRVSRGFTLIEVLVALLVFSLIASIAAKRSSQYILSYERTRDKIFASWIADNRVTELRLQEKPPGISETEEDIEFGPSDWQIKTAVIAVPGSSIRRVEVSVGKYRGTEDDPPPTQTLTAFIGNQQ